MEYRTAKEILTDCTTKGNILLLLEIEKGKIQTLLDLADGDQKTAEKVLNNMDDVILWNNVYNSYYDALHKVVVAFLMFDKIKSLNHLCLFAYLCETHPELELDWNFFEKVRTKRNGLHYYGQKINKEDWNSVSLQMKLYIKTLRNTVEEKLKSKENFDED